MVNAYYDQEDQLKTEATELMRTLEDSLATNRVRASQQVVKINKQLAPAKAKIHEIKAWAEQNNLDVLIEYCNFIAGSLEAASKSIVRMFRIVEQSGELFSNADAMIKTYERQIETIAYELEYLHEAIADGDTDSPALANIMRVARDEVEDEARRIGYDTCHYNDITDTTHHIRYHGLQGDETTAIRLLSLVTGNLKDPTREEIKAFKHLVQIVGAQCIASNGAGERK